MTGSSPAWSCWHHARPDELPVESRAVEVVEWWRYQTSRLSVDAHDAPAPVATLQHARSQVRKVAPHRVVWCGDSEREEAVFYSLSATRRSQRRVVVMSALLGVVSG
jgi:hypothetical protein